MTLNVASLKRIGRVAVPLAILAIVLPIVWRHSSQIRQYHLTISPGALACSYIALFTAFLLVVHVWTLLLKCFGLSLPYKRAFEMWYISNLAGYLPGKVWSIAGMVYLCEKQGLPRSKVLASGIITQIFSISAAFLLGAAYLSFGPSLKGIPFSRVLLLIVPTLLMVPIVFPRFSSRCLGPLGRRMEAQQIADALRPADRVRLFGFNVLCWIIYGVAFGLLANSVSRLPTAALLSIVPTFALAYTLGFMAIFAPSGLGVREGVLVLLLSPFYPASIALAIALAARLWFTLGEILFFVIAWQLQTGLYAHLHSVVRRAVAPLRSP